MVTEVMLPVLSNVGLERNNRNLKGWMSHCCSVYSRARYGFQADKGNQLGVFRPGLVMIHFYTLL